MTSIAPRDGTAAHNAPDVPDLATLRALATELGFTGLGVSGVDLAQAEQRLADWLARGYHGEMAWMARHGRRRSRPAELVPGTLRVISVRMDYWPAQAAAPWPVLESPSLGYVSRYALGQDYHKRVRQRLQRLADGIATLIGPFGYRVFCDSAPVLEKPLAEQAGLGWIGKHTCLIDRRGGSWFFLGELYTDLPLPVDTPARGHCGSCRACIDVCPTGAIVAPYVLDARRCISYLTIEHPGPIPESCARCSATASTAAMTASWCARGTSSRGRPTRPTLPRARAWTRHGWLT